MANTKISDLPAAAALTGAEVVPGVQGAGNVKLTSDAISNVRNARNGAASTPAVPVTGTWFTGGTSTTTKPQVLVEPTGTPSTSWSTSGTGFGVNAPAGFAGNLADFQVNGVSKAFITTFGGMTLNDTFIIGGSGSLLVSAGFIRVGGDAYFTRKAAANWQLGNADAAAPVAQKISVQSVAAGTSNTAGQVWTLKDSAGTGTGASGGFAFQTAPAGSSGTAQNAYADAFKINSPGDIQLAKAFTIAAGANQIPAAGTGGRMARITDGDASLAWGATAINSGAGATPYLVWDNGTNWTIVGK